MKAAAEAERGKHEAWFATDPDRKRTSSYQNGGLGTMLAISLCKLVGGSSIDDVDCVVCVFYVSQMRGIYMEWWTD
jgi:hypothetical protein